MASPVKSHLRRRVAQHVDELHGSIPLLQRSPRRQPRIAVVGVAPTNNVCGKNVCDGHHTDCVRCGELSNMTRWRATAAPPRRAASRIQMRVPLQMKNSPIRDCKMRTARGSNIARRMQRIRAQRRRRSGRVALALPLARIPPHLHQLERHDGPEQIRHERLLRATSQPTPPGPLRRDRPWWNAFAMRWFRGADTPGTHHRPPDGRAIALTRLDSRPAHSLFMRARARSSAG